MRAADGAQWLTDFVKTWARQISAYFELHKRYPKVSKVKEAKVKVALVLNRLGHVVSLAIAESSGDAAYDEAAMSMIRFMMISFLPCAAALEEAACPP